MRLTEKISDTEVIPEGSWRKWIQQHLQAVRVYTAGPRERRVRGEQHPVEDFLFCYYPYPLTLLENWHPEPGDLLDFLDEAALPPHFLGKFYGKKGRAVFLDRRAMTERVAQRLEWVIGLLEATSRNVPLFACHGLHEWAMVYQAEEIRHGGTAKLRLSQEQIDELVRSRSIVCTHHDAFRFFAKAAKPLNRHQPTLETRHENEQPGCVHVNMDLYKWAAKAMPWSGSKLFLECFQLAVKLRDLDMRASPYDLQEWDLQPVKIETPEGRRAYEMEQRALATEAEVLRTRLVARLRWVLSL